MKQLTITSHKDIMNGAWCIKGTRIPIERYIKFPKDYPQALHYPDCEFNVGGECDCKKTNKKCSIIR